MPTAFRSLPLSLSGSPAPPSMPTPRGREEPAARRCDAGAHRRWSQGTLPPAPGRQRWSRLPGIAQPVPRDRLHEPVHGKRGAGCLHEREAAKGADHRVARGFVGDRGPEWSRQPCGTPDECVERNVVRREVGAQIEQRGRGRRCLFDPVHGQRPRRRDRSGIVGARSLLLEHLQVPLGEQPGVSGDRLLVDLDVCRGLLDRQWKASKIGRQFCGGCPVVLPGATLEECRTLFRRPVPTSCGVADRAPVRGRVM